MKLRDYTANLFFLGIAFFIMKEAYALGLGTLRIPGMGFTAFCAAFILAALSLIHFAVIYFRAYESAGQPLFSGTLFTKILPTFVVLFACASFMPDLGFVVATCLLMALLITIVRQKVTWSALPVAIITAVACHLLFQTLLGGQFPRGPSGF